MSIDISREANYARCGNVVLRPEVREFAELMEKQLRANEDKGTWSNLSFGYLQGKIHESHKNLLNAAMYFLTNVKAPYTHDSTMKMGEVPTPFALRSKCADIANYAMMISDNITTMKIQ